VSLTEYWANERLPGLPFPSVTKRLTDPDTFSTEIRCPLVPPTENRAEGSTLDLPFAGHRDGRTRRSASQVRLILAMRLMPAATASAGGRVGALRELLVGP
jgi:hypothetical protein